MDKCIDEFLENYNPVIIEKHSDSSDFDANTVPVVSTKSGKHNLFRKKTLHGKTQKNGRTNSNTIPLDNKNSSKHSKNMIPVRDFDVTSKHDIDKEAQGSSQAQKPNPSKSTGDANHKITAVNVERNQEEPTPCFSNISRHFNNNTKLNSSAELAQEGHSNSGTAFCADCARRRIKKLNRRRQSYVVQPVYVVDNQAVPVPFRHANDRAPLLQHKHNVTSKQDSDASFELTSSESEIEKADQRKHGSRRRHFIDRFQKEMRKEYLKYEKEILRNRVLQYPSKRDYHFPCHIFYTPSHSTQNRTGPMSGDQSHIPSTSSGFWEYLFEKIRGKQVETRPCKCSQPMRPPLGQEQQQMPDTSCPADCCEPVSVQTYTDSIEMPPCRSCTQQTDQFPKLPSNVPAVQKKLNPIQVTCKCPKKKQKQHSDSNKQSLLPRQSLPLQQPQPTQNQNDMKPCQAPHDDITKTLEEQYNGEILCIHNPPCVLINGCVNLPYCKEAGPTVGTFWPVTQEKKSSFYHMCQKMKRNKTSHCEQGCQYHPPSIEVHTLQSVEVKREERENEKIIQSICNHKPPCEVVPGCCKPKFDPKLANSCVHVPMCERRPECLMEGKEEDGKLCEHKPKCTEVPLCSRKFVILTAKDTVGTQVRQKTKLVCRHEPPCIMIPKCLARIISESYIPSDAIPDCVHQPCCDMIPACCRRVAKDMPVLTSVDEGISLKLPRIPPVHKNRLIKVMKRNKRTNQPT